MVDAVKSGLGSVRQITRRLTRLVAEADLNSLLMGLLGRTGVRTASVLTGEQRQLHQRLIYECRVLALRRRHYQLPAC
jgi:hypothetical protein